MAERSDVIRGEIEETRLQLGETADALGQKANVPARTKGWVTDKKDALVSKVGEVTPDGDELRWRGSRVKQTAEDNPLGLAIAGAAVGFLAGLLAPSTHVEDEKLGPTADEVKSTAADAGREALEHGSKIAQATAEEAVETAKRETREHGEELTASLQDKARDVSRTRDDAGEDELTTAETTPSSTRRASR